MKNNDIKVGQKIYLKPIGGQAWRTNKIKEGIVSKVGKKYFYLEGFYQKRFFIENLRHDAGDYTANWQGYFSLEEIENEKEQIRLFSFISERFRHYSTPLSLEKLQAIYNIIES